jgi:1-aminocyclopropane-1-carboxylate deaminase/D-cysteine desulfhydrase-like pyridoxal-dependent ACC family enzyme
MEEVKNSLGLDTTALGIGGPQEWLSIYPGTGKGYAKSTAEELAFIRDFASTSGIVLDPVYIGKAMFYFFTSVLPNEAKFHRGDKILFLHTGGVFGLYDKATELEPLLPRENIYKMKVNPP